MSGAPRAPLTVADAVNRGYNLLVTGVLGLAAVGYGGLAFAEADWPDKIDDAGFIVVGAAALIWYLIGRNRFRRSAVPLVLAVLATAFQVLGLFLEHDDTAAVGDNIGGILHFGVLLILVAVQYAVTRNLQGRQ